MADLQHRAIALKTEGRSLRQIAQELGIGKSTVARILEEPLPQLSQTVPPAVPKVSHEIREIRPNPASDTSHAVPRSVPKLSHADHFLEEFLKHEYGIVDQPTDHIEVDPYSLKPR